MILVGQRCDVEDEAEIHLLWIWKKGRTGRESNYRLRIQVFEEGAVVQVAPSAPNRV